MNPAAHGTHFCLRSRLAHGFGVLRIWHFFVLLLVFIGSMFWLSTWFMRSEINSATGRLATSSSIASRSLESQFAALRDDFRVLVSLNSLETFMLGSTISNHDTLMVKRFFARHQDSTSRIEADLQSGEMITVQILPGNYLSSKITRSKPNSQISDPRASTVTYTDEYLTISELKPLGLKSQIVRVRLIIDHKSFFKKYLESYLMGQSDVWIWSVDENRTANLILSPILSPTQFFKAEKDACDAIYQDLSMGLEGIYKHQIFTPNPNSVISVYSPLRLSNQPTGLVFSTSRETHLKSLNRLSLMLGAIFIGTIVILLFWFGISFHQIARSEQAEIEARKRAETADRAKSEFVAAMSHEIRTPLNGVLGYAEILRRSGLSASQIEYLDVIRSSGDHLLSVLNDILDYSRIDAGALTLRSEEFSPVRVAENVIDMLTHAAAVKGLKLELTTTQNVPSKVVADAGRLRQILFNLVGNGIKFTHQGSVGVSIDATEKEGSYFLDFVVRDTGIGIDHAMLDRLFKPFSQIDSSNTRAYQGTGLGLAICKRLVQRMEGGITVETAPLEGSRFRFWIKMERLIEPFTGADTLSGRTILVIDSDPYRSQGVALQLSNLGARALTATNDRDAAQMIPALEHIDLALVEWPRIQPYDSQEDQSLYGKDGQRILSIALVDEDFEEIPSCFPAAWKHPLLGTVLEQKVLALLSSESSHGLATEVRDLEMKVLVVEDNAVNSALLVALLESRGISALVAENGTKALELLEVEAYDLIFMDVEMPGLDGMETTEVIRTSEKTRGALPCRIVGLSAHAFHDDRRAAIQAGMDDYITKPIDCAELDGVLKDAINALRSSIPSLPADEDSRARK